MQLVLTKLSLEAQVFLVSQCCISVSKQGLPREKYSVVGNRVVWMCYFCIICVHGNNQIASTQGTKLHFMFSCCTYLKLLPLVNNYSMCYYFNDIGTLLSNPSLL